MDIFRSTKNQFPQKLYTEIRYVKGDTKLQFFKIFHIHKVLWTFYSNPFLPTAVCTVPKLLPPLYRTRRLWVAPSAKLQPFKKEVWHSYYQHYFNGNCDDFAVTKYVRKKKNRKSVAYLDILSVVSRDFLLLLIHINKSRIEEGRKCFLYVSI